MNDKLAKKLRAQARAETVGYPDRLYDLLRPRSPHMQLLNARESTRGRYLLLKRLHRNATRKA